MCSECFRVSVGERIYIYVTLHIYKVFLFFVSIVGFLLIYSISFTYPSRWHLSAIYLSATAAAAAAAAADAADTTFGQRLLYYTLDANEHLSDSLGGTHKTNSLKRFSVVSFWFD